MRALQKESRLRQFLMLARIEGRLQKNYCPLFQRPLFIALNRCRIRIKSYCARHGRLTIFMLITSLSAANSLVEDLNQNITTGEPSERVRITTIDAFCDNTGIDIVDFIKTDTE